MDKFILNTTPHSGPGFHKKSALFTVGVIYIHFLLHLPLTTIYQSGINYRDARYVAISIVRNLVYKFGRGMDDTINGNDTKNGFETQYTLSDEVQRGFDEADQLLADKDYDEARAVLTGLLETDNDNPMVLNYIGVTYLYEKKFDEAAGCFREIIAKDPRFFLAYVNLSIAFTRSGKYDEADKLIKRIIKERPNDPIVWATIATYYAELVDYETAIKYNLLAFFTYPDFLRGAFNLACNFSKLGKYDEALIYLDKALADKVIFSVSLDNEDLDPIRDLPEFKRIVNKHAETHGISKRPITGHEIP